MCTLSRMPPDTFLRSEHTLIKIENIAHTPKPPVCPVQHYLHRVVNICVLSEIDLCCHVNGITQFGRWNAPHPRLLHGFAF